MSDPGFLTVTIPTSEFIRFCNTKAAIDAALECARVRGEALAMIEEKHVGFSPLGLVIIHLTRGERDRFRSALALQPGSPVLAEVVAAREEVERAARRVANQPVQHFDLIGGLARLDAALECARVRGEALTEAGFPALAEVLAAREERLAAAEAAIFNPLDSANERWRAAVAREDAARRKLGGGA